MEEVLELLIKIQGLYDEIKKITARLAEIPQITVKIEEEIAQANRHFNQTKDRIHELKKLYRLKEGDISENETKIDKLNKQTFSVKTNEEYRALLNELEYLRNQKCKIEEEMISILEEEEQLKASTSKLETETKEFVEKKKLAMANLKKEEEAATERERLLQYILADNLAKLPPDMRDIYERISKARGKAVCIISDHNTCTGCYANLTPQVMNDLKKRDKIVLCESCGRILIYAR